MKFTTLGLDYSFNSSRAAPTPEPYERTTPRLHNPPLGTVAAGIGVIAGAAYIWRAWGRDYQCDLAYAPDPRAANRRVPPPEYGEFKAEMPPLARATDRPVLNPEAEEFKLQISPPAFAANRSVDSPEHQEIKFEMPPLADAATQPVLPSEPEESKQEMPTLAPATTQRVRPPEPQEIKQEMPPLARGTTRRVLPPEPEDFKPEMPHGLLGSLFSWLRGGAPARRQLRMVEMVPLGEKRFVAIIHAQGRKYLVGGGNSGVALLTSLDEPASHSDSITAVAEPVGVAG